MNRQYIILGAVGALLVGVLLYQFVFAGGTTAPKAPAAAKAAPGAAAKAAANTAAKAAGRSARETAGAEGDDIQLAKRLERTDIDIDALMRDIEAVRFDYEQNEIDRNPMTPLVGGQIDLDPNAAELMNQQVSQGGVYEVINKKVSGIVWDERSPIAVVDDEIVSPGFTYPTGVRVVAIRPNAVIFQFEDTEIPVELEEQ